MDEFFSCVITAGRLASTHHLASELRCSGLFTQVLTLSLHSTLVTTVSVGRRQGVQTLDDGMVSDIPLSVLDDVVSDVPLSVLDDNSGFGLPAISVG